jgi:isopentenyl-diphosphate delta-isomerase
MQSMADQKTQFENRKRDHIRIALDPRAQSSLSTGLESVDLIHQALPEIDFHEIDLKTPFAKQILASPIYVSSMTAGHERGTEINTNLARFAERRGLLMGVGSQRRELEDSSAANEWKQIRKHAPKAILAGNIGLAQAIHAPIGALLALIENLEASALFIHLNALQECLQPEGTPQFRGGLQAIQKIAKALPVPVIVKEVGCGFSADTLHRLNETGIYAVDVSGLGGTHWGRVEGQRIPVESAGAKVAATFQDWGISTTQSLLNAHETPLSYEVWASGGVRTGLDVAKLIAMGAHMVGLAKPWLEAALEKDADRALENLLDSLHQELKISLFCTGAVSPDVLRSTQRWSWKKI